MKALSGRRMLQNYRLVGCTAVVCLVSALTFAQAPTVNEIVSNQNRNIAGILQTVC